MADLEKYIDGLTKKDEACFEAIYEETKTSVYAIIVAIVKDRDIANDLMQDTYLTMIEKIHQYKREKKFLPWLLTIARNKAIDYYRERKKEIVLDVIEFDSYIAKTPPKGERNALIEEMLRSLSDIELQVFLLYTMQNLKHKEIAKILNIPLGTSLWHYNKALKKINKLKGSDEHEVER